MDPDRKFNFAIGILLLLLGGYMVIQNVIFSRSLEKERACLAQHEVTQIQRNQESSKALVDLFNELRSSKTGIEDPAASASIDAYISRINAINEDRKADAIANICHAPVKK